MPCRSPNSIAGFRAKLAVQAKKRSFAATFVALLALGACSEREDILPGVREPLTITEQTAPLQPVVSALSLPAQVRNQEAAQFEGSPAYRTVHPALAATPALVWSARIGEGDSRKLRITADPVVGGGRVYTLDAASAVTAVSMGGQIAWQTDIRPPRDAPGDATGGGLAYHEGRLYVSSGYGVLTALDAQSGDVLWSQQLDATGSGRPLVVGDLVYLTAGDDTAWAVEAATGRIAWQNTASPSVANALGAPSPVWADQFVVFSFGSGELQAVFRQGGLRRWESSVLGNRPGRALSSLDDVTAAPVYDGGVLFAGSVSGRTVAIDAASGARLWTAPEGAVDPVLPIAGSVFLINDKNELMRLDRDSGARLWAQPLPNFTSKRPRRASEIFSHHGPVLAGGRLWVASGDGLLRGFDPSDGSLSLSLALPGGATTRPVVASGMLFVVSRTGELLAYQ